MNSEYKGLSYRESDWRKIKDFKKLYGRKYKVEEVFGENDGELVDIRILTKFPKRKEAEGESPFVIWEHSNTHLAALVPQKSGRVILEKYPFVEMQLDSHDGLILLFPTAKLDELKKPLKLRYRRKLSPEARANLMEVSKKGLAALKSRREAR